jgi:hypothetical protein
MPGGASELLRFQGLQLHLIQGNEARLFPIQLRPKEQGGEAEEAEEPPDLAAKIR